MKSKSNIGLIGEYYVGYELARRGIVSAKISNTTTPVTADLLVKGNVAIEIKTSVYSLNRVVSTGNRGLRSGGWGFTEMTRSEADYLVIVLLEKDLTVYKCFGTTAINSTGILYRRPTNEQILSSRRRSGPELKETVLDARWDSDPFESIGRLIGIEHVL